MKRVLNRTLSMVLMAGFVGAPVMTALADAPSETQASTARPTPAPGIDSLSKKELKELADYGSRHGEDVSDLRAYADGKKPSGDDALFKIRRQALALLLQRSGPVLERFLSKFPRAEKTVRRYWPMLPPAVKKLPGPDEGTIRTSLTKALGRVPGEIVTPFIAYML